MCSNITLSFSMSKKSVKSLGTYFSCMSIYKHKLKLIFFKSVGFHCLSQSMFCHFSTAK